MSTVLQLDDVAIRFGGVRAVDGVSLSVEAGDFVGLIGPNGAGKTTLIRMICRPAQAGSRPHHARRRRRHR